MCPFLKGWNCYVGDKHTSILSFVIGGSIAQNYNALSFKPAGGCPSRLCTEVSRGKRRWEERENDARSDAWTKTRKSSGENGAKTCSAAGKNGGWSIPRPPCARAKTLPQHVCVGWRRCGSREAQWPVLREAAVSVLKKHTSDAESVTCCGMNVESTPDPCRAKGRAISP
jgi:hypothetical protein